MTNDCIFCKIAAGEIPAHKVYEDENVFAFLDIAPCTEGHTVVIPKKHADTFTDMSEEDAAAYYAAVNRIAKKVKSGLSADGLSMGINVGTAAGQTVMHVHTHIIPRKENDGGGSLHDIVNTTVDTSAENFARVTQLIEKA